MTNLLDALSRAAGILAAAFNDISDVFDQAADGVEEAVSEASAPVSNSGVPLAALAVYGPVSIPEGFEATGEFREPADNELYLTLHSQKVGRGPGTLYGGARLILREVGATKASAPTFPEGVDEVYANPPVIPDGFKWTGEFRIATVGEQYLGINKQQVKQVMYGTTAGPRLILQAA